MVVPVPVSLERDVASRGSTFLPTEVSVTIELTAEQQRLLDSQPGTPPRVIDPRTNAAFVLVPAEDYERIREALEEEKRRKAIARIALRNAAGRMGQEP